MAAGALALALIFGLLIALIRLSRWRLLGGLAYVYTEFLRGTPALVQLFVIYFGLPDIGYRAVAGRGGDHRARTQRLGLSLGSLPGRHRGHPPGSDGGGALSLGMTPARAMRYIVLPQAIRTMLPPITNFSIMLLKDTALVSVVAVPEIMVYARNLVTETFQSMHRLSDCRRDLSLR